MHMNDIDQLFELKYLLGSIVRGDEKDPVMQVPQLHALVLRLDLNPDLEDENCNVFLSIDSELREFPIDPGFRSRCHPEFLGRMDSELLELKQLYGKSVVEACEKLYKRIEKLEI
ncbi:MAG: hypothetical protein DKT66_23000 [Candidatus Melainabacteria bacterium]|nr:MAG: hypothetical protein DKT66_23000 [Candidatus Melainabacteria bacterium]